MNDRKIPGRPGWPNTNSETRRIATSALLLLCTLFPPQFSWAQESANRITDISVSPQGELIIEVDGEGFDPMLRLETAPNGEARIVVQGQGVTIDPEVSRKIGQIGSELQGRIPAIDKASIAKATGMPDGGFQLVLTAYRRLQPQIRINNGSQIVIGLIGDRSLPQAVRLKRQRIEQQRMAALKHQEALKKQAEQQKQIALQNQAAQQQRAEIARQASLQRQEAQRLAEIKRQEQANQNRENEERYVSSTSAQSNNQSNISHTPNGSEPEDDFSALIRQEAKRLAEQQQKAIAYQNQVHNFLPDELSASPAQESASPVSSSNKATGKLTTKTPANNSHAITAKSATHTGRLQNLKELATDSGRQGTTGSKNALSTTTKTGASKTNIIANGQKNAGRKTSAQSNIAANANSLSPNEKADWEQAYVAQKPMSTGEFITELQVAQPNGHTDSNRMAKSGTMTINSGSPSAQNSAVSKPATSQPEPANHTRQTETPGSYVPVNFNGATNDSNEDNAPTDPLRLKKLPPNFAPEPDSEAAPPASPAHSQPASQTPAKSYNQSPTHSGSSASTSAASRESIYAVIHQPGASPVLRQAWQSLMSGNADGAQELLRQYLHNSPRDTGARYLLAEILLSPVSEKSGGNAAKTAENLAARRKEAVRQLLTNYAQSLHWPSCQALVELFIEDNKLEEANGLLKQLRHAYPNEAGVHYEEGRLHEAMDNLDAARTAYQKSLGLEPANAEAHYRLAQVELKADHLEAAHWELLQALSWSPHDSRIYKLLGYIADRSGRKQQAAQAYREALPLDALINYARSLEAQNQPERALSLYQAAETLAGDNSDILYNLAMIYSNTQRPARATAVLHRFLSLNGTRQDNRVTKAKSLLQQLEQQK